jgi:HSP20 family protein
MSENAENDGVRPEHQVPAQHVAPPPGRLELAGKTPNSGARGAGTRRPNNQKWRNAMMYRSLFPRDMFAELDRLQRELQQAVDVSPSIRGLAGGGFPAMNVGSTPRSVEIYAFAPGLDPAGIEVQLEKGVLTISGERKSELPPPEAKATVHIDERFAGRFRRVVTLPDDADPNAVQASYRDGVLHVSIQRVEAALPRRIAVQ